MFLFIYLFIYVYFVNLDYLHLLGRHQKKCRHTFISTFSLAYEKYQREENLALQPFVVCNITSREGQDLTIGSWVQENFYFYSVILQLKNALTVES